MSHARSSLLLGCIRNRWMTLVASFFIMACAGALYSFGIYSQELKTVLGYDQETVSTIGFFKDLGANIGIVAGILYDVTGGWLVLLLAAVFNTFGYVMAWAAVTGHIARPQVWHMCAYLWVGASSGAFASTTVIVTCVKNFPRNRGIVIGLLKGFVGLSGAMLTQIYKAIYGNNPSSFMLVVAIFPSVVFLVCMLVVRPVPPRQEDEKETRNFYVFLAMAILLALFLMAVIVAQHLGSVSKPANQGLMAVMVVILALPLLVVIESETEKRKQDISQDIEKTADAPANVTDEDTEDKIAAPSDDAAKPEPTTGLTGGNMTKPELTTGPDATVGTAGAAVEKRVTRNRAELLVKLCSVKRAINYVVRELQQMPERGEDHSPLQALASLDLWIVFVATTAGLGSGLMAIDNMGQLGSSLGYSDSSISTFVSLLSIWNFSGRVGFGFISEACLQKQGLPRPVFLALVLGLLAMGHLYIAAAWRGALYIGSLLVGMCFGAQMPVMFAIISELFGLKYFGTLYNVGILASPLGTYLLSVKVAGHLYDQQALKQERAQKLPRGEDLLCVGKSCYRNSFFIMAAVCAFGCVISLVLAFRTRGYYRKVFLSRNGPAA